MNLKPEVVLIKLEPCSDLVIQGDEDWYPRYHPAWTQKAQGGVHYDSVHYLEDSKGSWHAPQGIDNYIYKNICKISK
jgi:hypothetical protein